MELSQVVRVPCKGGTTDLELDISLGDDTITAHPPEVAVDIASSITCPSTVSLDATITDPESDVDTVRWYVNDVLLKQTLTSIGVPSGAGSVDFAVVACDSRGACTRDEKTVDCN